MSSKDRKLQKTVDRAANKNWMWGRPAGQRAGAEAAAELAQRKADRAAMDVFLTGLWRRLRKKRSK